MTKLKFSKNPPTKPGWYLWHDVRPWNGVCAAQVIRVRGKLVDKSSYLPPAECGGWWSQRLVPEKVRKP